MKAGRTTSIQSRFIRQWAMCWTCSNNLSFPSRNNKEERAGNRAAKFVFFFGAGVCVCAGERRFAFNWRLQCKWMRHCHTTGPILRRAQQHNTTTNSRLEANKFVAERLPPSPQRCSLSEGDKDARTITHPEFACNWKTSFCYASARHLNYTHEFVWGEIEISIAAPVLTAAGGGAEGVQVQSACRINLVRHWMHRTENICHRVEIWVIVDRGGNPTTNKIQIFKFTIYKKFWVIAKNYFNSVQ
jgi:hypothetical protein